jgi:hypothetical protein
MVAVLAACGGPDHDDDPDNASEAAAGPAPMRAEPKPSAALPEPVSAADSSALRAQVAARGDSVRAAFAKATRLKWSEVFGLRQDKNAKQIATAQRLGVRASGDAQIRRLVSQGRLVALGDSTEFWILRKMTHSVPYVTPDARALLEQVGRRFHARLDSLGLPRYRMKVTSALRTDATQTELRKINSYASQTVSAHEFGTTVDVSHERFAVPAPKPGSAGELEAEVLEEVGKEHAKVLQAELGRTLAEMRDQGKLFVMMEDRQPVYHFTVAQPMAR